MTHTTINMSIDIVCEYFTQLVLRAMQTEVNLTPKPGLVDSRNSGAHCDMDLQDFHRSAKAISVYVPEFILCGFSTAKKDTRLILSELRIPGKKCEQAMYKATSGVNTHKGALFSLGLFCAAIGRHYALNQSLTPRALSHTVASICQGIVNRELNGLSEHYNLTAGQLLFVKYGLTGARGEAENGYPLVINIALPYFRQQIKSGLSQDYSLLNTLLLIMSYNNDTNIVSRGGLSSLQWIKDCAEGLLQNGGVRSASDLPGIYQLDDLCISRNLSPGGGADLLMLTWFLSHFHEEESQ
ncbi:triphosphoribosyl-dephospho-CoA synthase CitG [Klebsiella quasivariicola]